MNQVFPGFTSGIEVVPSQFFEELLPYINAPAELKVTVFAFHLLNQFEGDKRFLLKDDYLEQKVFMRGLSEDEEEAERLLDEGLDAAEERGTFLKADYNGQSLFFLNSPRGRNALASLADGTWIPDAFLHLNVQAELFRPTIFKLYEENIGPLTPMIADVLRDCEKDYPYEWIRDAVEEAVMNNARSWRYVESILRNWKEKGLHGSY